MKNQNDHQNEKNNDVLKNLNSDFQPSFEMNVYNEMADSTSQSIDVFKLIEQQFSDLNRLATKRSFLLKEISHYMK